MKVLRTGTVITCPVDGASLYEVTRDVFEGELITAEQFRGIAGTIDPKPGEPATCSAHDVDLLPVLNGLTVELKP